ncbi:hypothetical protein pdam_00003934 [Pocillopora damicornis]|uniref:Uncharacterized protein n=1 Tax=Pocillopora damicornis TaxID=46731 RepID=A0A3M6U5Y9_POCDA|nr:hypothetical protein pdam_00003934 [Pocillopora damicornis]
MAELSGVVRAINDLVVRIERLNDPSEIGSVVLRLDYITRMLVNLDVADDIVNKMSCLHETVLAIEADSSSPVGQGYRTQLNRAGLDLRNKSRARSMSRFQLTLTILLLIAAHGFDRCMRTWTKDKDGVTEVFSSCAKQSLCEKAKERCEDNDQKCAAAQACYMQNCARQETCDSETDRETASKMSRLLLTLAVLVSVAAPGE